MPFMKPTYDAISGATPLSAFKFNGVFTEPMDLAMGMVSGSAGETNALLILLGGIYLALRKMLNWRIPVAILGTVYFLGSVFHHINPEAYPPGTFMIFSGGLMLGAVFMATDMVASPVTSLGVVIYGVLIGILIVVIRLMGWPARRCHVCHFIGQCSLSPYRQGHTKQGVWNEKTNGMSTVETTPAQNSTKSLQMLRVMGGLGAVCALLIVLTYEGTADRIAQLKDEALQQAVFSVLPNTKSTQAFYIDPDQKTISNGPSGNDIGIFAGYDKDKALTGIAIEASGRGYA